jgi:hypothetical protein
MSERDVSDAEAVNPLARMILGNPLASVLALNVAITIFGGGMVYQQLQSAISGMEDRVARIETAAAVTSRAVHERISKADARITASDHKSAATFSALSREISEIKVAAGRIETAVQFLVEQERRRPRE